jgi:hypothetical protein
MEAAENDPEYAPPPVSVFSTEPPNHRGSASSASDTQAAEAATASESKPIEKTISCVSCRKRKLKCDRIKPRWYFSHVMFPAVRGSATDVLQWHLQQTATRLRISRAEEESGLEATKYEGVGSKTWYVTNQCFIHTASF